MLPCALAYAYSAQGARLRVSGTTWGLLGVGGPQKESFKTPPLFLDLGATIVRGEGNGR